MLEVSQADFYTIIILQTKTINLKKEKNPHKSWLPTHTSHPVDSCKIY